MSTIKRNKPSLLVTNPELAKEWDYEKNAPLTPDNVTAGSNKKVWWKCVKKHGWEATIAHRTGGTKCPFCTGRYPIKGQTDLKTINPILACEWDSGRNYPVTPSDVTACSGKKVWWKCSEGHSWESTVANRSNGQGCPFCSRRYVVRGITDLCSSNPKLAKEWNYSKNKPLNPDSISVKSHKNVWWICSNGHEWKAVINSRNKGSDCPICSQIYKIKGISDLATKNPQLAREWNYAKNNELRPDEISATSHKIVWWICEKGHEWKTSVNGRNRGNGCPYCAGQRAIVGVNDLQTIAPELLSEWNYSRNNITPSEVCGQSNKKVWWICSLRHEWQTTVANKRRGDKCPYCSNRKLLVGFNDLETVYPDLGKEWNYEKNKPLKPSDVIRGARKNVWWKCEYGHEWRANIDSRVQDHGCPYCVASGTSLPEQGIAYYLSFITVVEQRIKIEGQEIDVYLPKYKIGIEYDGMYYHKNAKKDDRKDSILKRAGITVIRVIESDRNHIDTNHIYFITDNMGLNYENALKMLLNLLSSYTDNKQFEGIQINIQEDKINIRNRFSFIKKQNSIAFVNPVVSKEWNYERNGKLTPEMFAANSNEKVWWICSKGHEWQAQIQSRNKGNGCPYCAGKKTLSGFNDFETWCNDNERKDLLEEWNRQKNTVVPSEVSLYSQTNILWKCSIGHEWQATVASRQLGGCPYCSNHKVLIGYNDLYTLAPKLAKEWDYEKNKNLKNRKGEDISDPRNVTPASGQKVWWKCSKCGSSWNAAISSRQGKMSCGCPVCAGRKVLPGYNDLQSQKPDLSKEWNYEKNDGLTPYDVYVGSVKKVWWKCEKKHEWLASVCSRSGEKGTNCPYCSGKSVLSGFNDLQTCNPQLAEEWNYEKNKDMVSKSGIDMSTPDKVSPNSNKKVWWKCQYGHEWEAIVANRNKGVGCPFCANKRKRKSVINVDTKQVYVSTKDAEQKTGISDSSISLCCNGKQKTAGGYHWKYGD